MFFENHGAAEASYINTRDDNKYSSDKLFIEELWTIYERYADSHFKQDAKFHFFERFWEMYLGATLIKRGYLLQGPISQGPEFYINMDSRRMWFEAIAPSRGEGNDAVPETPLGVVTKPPHREILLRLTNAVVEKHRKYASDKKKGIIQNSDFHIVAVNGSRIFPVLYGVTLPYILQVLYPAGDLTITFDSRTGKTIDSYYQYRDGIFKINRSTVPTDSFLNTDYCGISAVIYSYADPWNGKEKSNIGSEFITIHNLKATNQVPHGFFFLALNIGLRNKKMRSIST
jgi:hypothetical protein